MAKQTIATLKHAADPATTRRRLFLSSSRAAKQQVGARASPQIAARVRRPRSPWPPPLRERATAPQPRASAPLAAGGRSVRAAGAARQVRRVRAPRATTCAPGAQLARAGRREAPSAPRSRRTGAGNEPRAAASPLTAVTRRAPHPHAPTSRCGRGLRAGRGGPRRAARGRQRRRTRRSRRRRGAGGRGGAGGGRGAGGEGGHAHVQAQRGERGGALRCAARASSAVSCGLRRHRGERVWRTEEVRVCEYARVARGGSEVGALLQTPARSWVWPARLDCLPAAGLARGLGRLRRIEPQMKSACEGAEHNPHACTSPPDLRNHDVALVFADCWLPFSFR